MLRYPDRNAAQQVVYGPLDALLAQYPGLTQWLEFVNIIGREWDTYSPAAFQTLADLATVIARVADYIYTQTPLTQITASYLLQISLTAWTIRTQSLLAANIATGTAAFTINTGAQTILQQFLAWDPILSYTPPTNFTYLFNQMMAGISASPSV